MVSNAYLQNTNKQAISYTNIQEEDITQAAKRVIENDYSSNAAADVFLRKVWATTGAMAHTNEMAKKARNKMYSMIARFGLPALLFTITPEDGMNF